ncbi:MAG: TlpA family protein disulfide reductase [Mongoliitalea sp.]
MSSKFVLAQSLKPEIAGQKPPTSENLALPFYLIVEVKGRNLSDTTLTIFLWEQYINTGFQSLPPVINELSPKNGSFFSGNIGAKVFEFTSIPLKTPSLINVSYELNYLLKDFYAFPGDTVKLVVEKDLSKTYFIGPNDLNYQIQQDFDRELRKSFKLKTPIMIGASKEAMLRNDQNVALYEEAVASHIKGLNPLMEFISNVSAQESHLMRIKTDLLNQGIPGNQIKKAYEGLVSHEFIEFVQAEYIGKLFAREIAVFKSFNSELNPLKQEILEGVKHLTNDFISIKHIDQAFAFQDLLIELGIGFNLVGHQGIIPFFEQYPPILKEILLTRFIGKNFKSQEQIDYYLKEAKSVASLGWTNQVLDQLIQSRSQGAKFKEISLPNADGNIVNSIDWEGKVVLIDFWFTGCKACIEYYEKCLKPAEEYFKGNPDVLFVSINTDKNQSTWLKSVNAGRYTSNHAINLFAGQDLGKELLTFYNINSFPSQLLLDKDLKIYRSGNFARDPSILQQLILEAINHDINNQP